MSKKLLSQEGLTPVERLVLALQNSGLSPEVILGVQYPAKIADSVKAVFRGISSVIHPDIWANVTANELLTEISLAKDEIVNADPLDLKRAVEIFAQNFHQFESDARECPSVREKLASTNNELRSLKETSELAINNLLRDIEIAKRNAFEDQLKWALKEYAAQKEAVHLSPNTTLRYDRDLQNTTLYGFHHLEKRIVQTAYWLHIDRRGRVWLIHFNRKGWNCHFSNARLFTRGEKPYNRPWKEASGVIRELIAATNWGEMETDDQSTKEWPGFSEINQESALNCLSATILGSYLGATNLERLVENVGIDGEANAFNWQELVENALENGISYEHNPEWTSREGNNINPLSLRKRWIETSNRNETESIKKRSEMTTREIEVASMRYLQATPLILYLPEGSPEICLIPFAGMK